MTQTISARTGDKLILDQVVQFLTTDYGMQVADMRISQISDHSESGGCMLNIDVNDHEADDIRTELLKSAS